MPFETRANVMKAIQGHILAKAVYGGLFRAAAVNMAESVRSTAAAQALEPAAMGCILSRQRGELTARPDAPGGSVNDTR